MGRHRKSDHHLPPRLYQKNGGYYYVHQNNKWEFLGRDLADAKRKWAVIEQPAETADTTSALIDEYLVKAAPKKAPRTYADNLKEAEYLKLFFGKMRPHNILPMHVGQYLEARASAGAPVRANREKALLSIVFTWAMRQEKWGQIITVNPCRGVHRNPEHARERIIEDREYQAVYALAETPIRRLMELVYRTLQRPEDLIIAGPANIKTVAQGDAEIRVLRIKQRKTGKLVEIVITGEIDRIIQESMGDKITGFTFIHTRKGKPYSYSGLASMFRRYVKKAGLRDFGIYDIKGKGATDMYRAGTPLEVIQHLIGHDSVTTTEIYIKARMATPSMPNQRVMSV